MPAIPFAFGSNPARHPTGGVARLINCYATDVGDGQRARLPIMACDGLTDFATHSGAGLIRAMHVLNGTLYVVAGRVLSAFDAAGSETVIGGIPSDGPVSTALNRRSPNPQIAIVCDGLAFMLAGNVLTNVTDPDLPPAISVAFIGGYFIYAHADGRYTWSAIDEGSMIDALDFATAEAIPDGLVHVRIRGEDVVLIGPQSSEFHRIVPATEDEDPFARSAVAQFGCLAARSVAEITVVSRETIAETLGWVATDRQGRYAGVMLLEGYSARKISPPALDEIIRAEAAPADITGTAWVTDGHGFYALSGTNWTWVFDTSTSLWHERSSYDDLDHPTRWRAVQVVDFGGRLIAGGRDGRLYVMGADAQTEAGDPLVMTLQSSPIPGEIDAVELQLATGVGQTFGNQEPAIGLSWSEDGQNWSGERWRGLGAEAQHRQRVRWTRLGSSRNGPAGRSLRLQSSAAVIRALYGAEYNPKE